MRDSKHRELTKIIGIKESIYPHQHKITGYDVVFEMQNPVCQGCNSPLKKKSTKNRRLFYTLKYGKINATYTVYRCDNPNCVYCKNAEAIRPEELDKLVPPGQKCGYDIIDLIGQKRCLNAKQRREVIDLLAISNIYISEGSITNITNKKTS